MNRPKAADMIAELEKVTSPATTGFSVRDLPSAPGYKIGRGMGGVIVLLTPADPAPEPPTRLRTLQLDPRIRVRIQKDDGTTVQEEHGLVQLEPVDPELLPPFLMVAAAFIRMLGPAPAPGVVSTAMRGLVKIFDPVQLPRGSVLGLWAELLVIISSNNPAAMVDAWHAHVDAAFDFSALGSRLEVKATTRGERVHVFNLRQLKPLVGAEVYVASIMTTESGAGSTISDLVSRLEQSLSDDAGRQVKVHTQVAETLGSDWAKHVSRAFDDQQGKDSLAFLDPTEIPQVAEPPSGVREVSLTVDCTHVPHRKPATGLAGLVNSHSA